jgi:Tfp pilus assembly protein PilV
MRVTFSASGLEVNDVSVVSGSELDNLYVFYTDPTSQTNVSEKLLLTDSGVFSNTDIDFPSGTYAAGAIKIAYSADNGTTMSSNAFEFPALPLSGGGINTGGGNNGGNDHNNMASLELAYDGYNGVVSQTNTITVLGETRAALTADEVITVDVPLAKFKKVLKYSSEWDAALTGDQAGEQPRPRVKFSPTASDSALTQLQNMLASISAKGTGAASGRNWTDDAGVDHSLFGAILLNRTFTNSALDDDEVPRESIRKIVEGSITVPDIDATVTELDSQGAAATLKGQLESLFEQAVNAGRVKTTDAADGSFKNPSFQEGDTMSFLVKYDFTKTRAYQVDDEVVDSATAGRATITVNGQTVDLSGYEEDSDAHDVTYEIRLRAVA